MLVAVVKSINRSKEQKVSAPAIHSQTKSSVWKEKHRRRKKAFEAQILRQLVEKVESGGPKGTNGEAVCKPAVPTCGRSVSSLKPLPLAEKSSDLLPGEDTDLVNSFEEPASSTSLPPPELPDIDHWGQRFEFARPDPIHRTAVLDAIARLEPPPSLSLEARLEKLEDAILAIAELHELDKISWTNCVNAMKESRDLKEIRLRTYVMAANKGLDTESLEPVLDRLDEIEKIALAALYRNFRNFIGLPSNGLCLKHKYPHDQCTCLPFDKNRVDEEMEWKFGSLDNDPCKDLSFGDAQALFSDYLCRKVWCPCPWRKTLSALDGFKDRVLKPLDRGMDEGAALLMKTLTRTLIRGARKHAARFQAMKESPRSSCLERSFAEGGKRMAIFSQPKAQRGYVKPVAIYTGGKIRVITIDSYTNVDAFAWVNKIVAWKFRKLRCSIFGGKVDLWFSRNKALLQPKDDQWFCSGDLESATDLFDGRLSDVIIDELAAELGFDGERAKTFTTQATLKIGASFLKQRRGQLMGSVISFPVLCIMSLGAYLLSRDDGLSIASSWKKLQRLGGVGINGDDLVFVGTQAQIDRWVDSVERIGGRVSRGKSLKNKRYFTVNSELWCNEGKINCARASLVTALTGDNRYFINAAVEWKEYVQCTLISKEGTEVFDLVNKLNLDIPAIWGGMGIHKQFNYERLLDAYKRSQLQRIVRGGEVRSRAYVEEQLPKNEDPLLLERRFEVFVPKSMKDVWSRIYESKERHFALGLHETRNLLVEQLLGPHWSDELLDISRFDFRTDQEILSSMKLPSPWALGEMYDLSMKGLKSCKLPSSLFKSFYAEVPWGTEHDALEFRPRGYNPGILGVRKK